VVLRHVALREHQVVALDAPDVDLVLVEGLPTLGAPFLADDDREHSVPSGGGRVHVARAHTSPASESGPPEDCRRMARSVSTACRRRAAVRPRPGLFVGPPPPTRAG